MKGTQNSESQLPRIVYRENTIIQDTSTEVKIISIYLAKSSNFRVNLFLKLPAILTLTQILPNNSSNPAQYDRQAFRAISSKELN